MTEKQFNYIKRLDAINKNSYRETPTISEAMEAKREKITTRLASKVIAHLKEWDAFLRYRWGTFSDCLEFDRQEEELLAEISKL